MNYNNNDGALLLSQQFLKHSDFVFITDSGSNDQHWLFRKTDTPFYRGNLDKASSLYLNTNCKGCLYICSDVIISEEMCDIMMNHINNLDENILIYTPVVNGKSHSWLKKQGNGFVDIPFAEGMIFYASDFLIESVYSIYLNGENQLGWGLDIWWAYIAKYKLGKNIVMDNDCNVYHPDGTNYNTGDANEEMKKYISTKDSGFKTFCQQILGVVV
jgi:hypothetical protein